MKNNKILIMLILLSTLRTPLFSEDARIIKVGAFNYYPGIFKDADGEIKGFYVDALAEISRLENIRFEYVFGTWDEGLTRIRGGDVDVLTSVAFTEERSSYMDFTDTPLLTVWGELYANNASEIDSIRQVLGKKIGVMRNDFNANNFKELTRSFGIQCEFVEFDSFDAIFLALKLKDIDAGVASVTYGAAKQREFGLRSTGILFNPFDIHFTVAKGKNRDILSLLDRYLTDWKHDQNSVFNVARQKWSHGSVGFIEVTPEWVPYVEYGVPAIILIGFAFIVILRHQVKKATVKIREGEKELKAIFEAANIGISITDEHGRFVMFNAWFIDKFGYSEDELRSKTNLDIAYPDDAEAIDQLFKGIIEKKMDRHRIETRFVAKSGGVFWGDLSVSAIYGQNDSVASVVAVIAEITETKQAIERIESLLKEKELLLREVYHRIKNNMGAIVGLISMQIDSAKDQSTKVSLDETRGRVQSIMTLYDRLNCTDNYRELPVSDYINPLVKEIIHSHSRGKHISTQTDIADYVMNIRILTPLGIIVNELMTNIMKYAFVGRTEGLITVGLRNDGERMTLTVSDNGIGMPPEIDFVNTTGFGMRIVRLLCDQIGGTVRLERDSGTRIIIEFNDD